MRSLSARFGPASFYREALAIALPVMLQQFIMSMVSLIQILMIYYGGPVFRTSGLRLKELAFVIAAAVSVILFDLGRKILLRAYKRKGFI